MSLDDGPTLTLKMMKGRLESIEIAWSIASNAAKKREINEDFMALAEEIKRQFGEEGAKAVNEVVAKHKALNVAWGY
jgi:citrate lyase gamma subunit